MYLFWFVLAGFMVFGYLYSEWKVYQAIIKKIHEKEETILPGKKTIFVIARSLFAFIGVSAFYFGLISFIRAEIVFGCWLLPASIVGLLVAFSTYQRVKYLRFEDNA